MLLNKRYFVFFGFVVVNVLGCTNNETRVPLSSPSPQEQGGSGEPRKDGEDHSGSQEEALNSSALQLNQNRDPEVESLLSSLSFVVADQIETAPELSAVDSAFATAFAADLLECGASEKGPRCLNRSQSPSEVKAEEHEILDLNGEKLLHYRLSFQGESPRYFSPLIMLYRVSSSASEQRIDQLRVLKPLQPMNEGKLESYLQDSARVQLLATITFSDNAARLAIDRAENPASLRELYHMSDIALRVRSGALDMPQTVARLRNQMIKHRDFIAQSEDFVYHEALVLLAIDRLKLRGRELGTVTAGLLNSGSNLVKQVAASSILASQPDRLEVKPLVMEALKNSSRSEIRLHAFRALLNSDLPKSTEEEGQIILRMADYSSSVREIAVSMSVGISLNQEHLSALQVLSQDPRPEIRRQAILLLREIRTDDSTTMLMQMIFDQDTGITQDARQALIERQISVAHVPAFVQKLQEDSNPVNRLLAVHVLAINGSDMALMALIERMDDGQFGERRVQSAIHHALSQKETKDSFIAHLMTKSRHPSELVRHHILSLLAKNRSLEATRSIIQMAPDLGFENGDIQDQAFTILRSRRILPEHVVDLQMGFESANDRVRARTAELLRRIRTDESRSVLQKQAERETDRDVQSIIRAGLLLI